MFKFVRKAPKPHLGTDERGVAAIEFAFIAPIMLTMIMLIIDISNAVSLHWRMGQLNRTLADLSSQEQRINQSNMDKIFAASWSVLTPYKGSPPEMHVYSVVVDKNGIPKVCWGYSKNGTGPHALNEVINMPADLKQPKTGWLMAITKLPFSGYLSPTLAMNSQPLFFRPRAGLKVGADDIEQVVKVESNGTEKSC